MYFCRGTFVVMCMLLTVCSVYGANINDDGFRLIQSSSEKWSGGVSENLDDATVSFNGIYHDVGYVDNADGIWLNLSFPQSLDFVDVTPPTIIGCPDDIEVDGNVINLVPDVTGSVIATDDVTVAGNLVITQEPAAGTPVAPGAHTITITVADEAGNEATCTLLFIVSTFMPADTNQDNLITMSEAITYVYNWQATGTIPMDYAIRAAYLWQHGEAYHYDPLVPCPACFVSDYTGMKGLATVNLAASSVTVTAADGVATIVIIPPVQTSAWGIEVDIPTGMEITALLGSNVMLNSDTGKLTAWGLGDDVTEITIETASIAVADLAVQATFDGLMADTTRKAWQGKSFKPGNAANATGSNAEAAADGESIMPGDGRDGMGNENTAFVDGDKQSEKGAPSCEGCSGCSKKNIFDWNALGDWFLVGLATLMLATWKRIR